MCSQLGSAAACCGLPRARAVLPCFLVHRQPSCHRPYSASTRQHHPAQLVPLSTTKQLHSKLREGCSPDWGAALHDAGYMRRRAASPSAAAAAGSRPCAPSCPPAPPPAPPPRCQSGPLAAAAAGSRPTGRQGVQQAVSGACGDGPSSQHVCKRGARGHGLAAGNSGRTCTAAFRLVVCTSSAAC